MTHISVHHAIHKVNNMSNIYYSVKTIHSQFSTLGTRLIFFFDLISREQMFKMLRKAKQNREIPFNFTKISNFPNFKIFTI